MPAPVFAASQVTQGSKPTNGDMIATRPSGTLDGHLLITSYMVQSTSTSLVITPPAGWNLIYTIDISTADKKHAVYWKIASSEPSTWTWTLANGTTITWTSVVSRYTGSDLISPINVSGVQLNASSTNLTAPSVTTTLNDCLLVMTGAENNGRTYTPPGTMTERWEDRCNSGTHDISHYGATQDFLTAGSTGTRVATLNAATANVGGLFAISSPLPGSLPKQRPLAWQPINRRSRW